jgi:hypothetical protein
MLPFSSTQGPLMGPGHAYTETYDYPSIRTWSINQNGSVNMEKAGIMLSSRNKPSSTAIRASIRIPGVFSTGLTEQCDLYTWIHEFRTFDSHANFAISLYQQTKQFHVGMILKQVDGSTLVKIGTFMTDEITKLLIQWIHRE